ncbi:MAG: RlmE family RNA methyltransferase [Methanoregulaceae archaeon]|nr:RlmE family RNA methyltransferase [Methanoregulaceae archaeon]
MGSQWGKDRVYSRAVREGYRSRASYKLLDIQDRHQIIREGDHVVDLGAAPGSWLQVVRLLTGGIVLGIDLVPIAPLEGVRTMTADFTNPAVVEEIMATMPYVSVVLSDASPKLSGQRSYDQARAIALGESALALATKVLKPGGNFVVKSFQGEDFNHLLSEVRRHFLSVRTYRSRATRRGSTEIYIIAKNFAGDSP